MEEQIALLEKISKNTGPKTSMQFTASGNDTLLRVRFTPSIDLDKDKKYEIALVNLETYYSFPNIDESNSLFRYSNDSGTTWFDINLPEGSYGIDDIDSTIQELMKEKGHYHEEEGSYVELKPNINTLKSILSLRENYQVDFNQENSIGKVLGFDKKIYSAEKQESENIVNILHINSILINLNIISNSYLNGKSQPVIYSFFPQVDPGYKIVETPAVPVYLPIISDRIDTLVVEVTDQNGDKLNLRGENLTIRFHLREM